MHKFISFYMNLFILGVTLIIYNLFPFCHTSLTVTFHELYYTEGMENIYTLDLRNNNNL